MKTHLYKNAVWFVAAALSVVVLAAWSSPVAAADVEAGGATFKTRCAVCHGSSGAGDGPMGKMLKPPPPNLSDGNRMAERTDEDLTKVITEGKDKMPSYDGKLSAEEIQNVVALIRTLAK
jgi:mono/diheme cytochrome c family protein